MYKRQAIRTLRARMRKEAEFPHEVGVFLGYPLADVVGFVRNGGRNCLLCGQWKVYARAQEAAMTFERLRKCKQVYERLFRQGYPLTRLTVGTRATL